MSCGQALEALFYPLKPAHLGLVVLAGHLAAPDRRPRDAG